MISVSNSFLGRKCYIEKGEIKCCYIKFSLQCENGCNVLLTRISRLNAKIMYFLQCEKWLRRGPDVDFDVEFMPNFFTL